MYVSDGVLRKRRPCGLWLIPALMWSIFNLIALFFLNANRVMHDRNKQKNISEMKSLYCIEIFYEYIS